LPNLTRGFTICKLNCAGLGKPAILKFAGKHADALAPLMNWYRIAKRAEWGSLTEVRKDFAHADVVGRRTLFKIHGNEYRLIARVNYRSKGVFILFILTHAEYSKGDWKR
jgi:mRNA interferase HigB